MKKLYTLLFFITTLNTFCLQAQETEKELLDLKRKGCEEAINVGKSYNITLDYSDNSIKDVEFILGDINKEYVKSKNTEGLIGLALMFGFYIIEVVEKNHGEGKIERNHKTIGEDSFPFYWKGSTLFPYGWCVKRILDGDEDNVEVKYKAFVLSETK
jgi:hypothetical protein